MSTQPLLCVSSTLVNCIMSESGTCRRFLNHRAINSGVSREFLAQQRSLCMLVRPPGSIGLHLPLDDPLLMAHVEGRGYVASQMCGRLGSERRVALKGKDNSYHCTVHSFWHISENLHTDHTVGCSGAMQRRTTRGLRVAPPSIVCRASNIAELHVHGCDDDLIVCGADC